MHWGELAAVGEAPAVDSSSQETFDAWSTVPGVESQFVVKGSIG